MSKRTFEFVLTPQRVWKYPDRKCRVCGKPVKVGTKVATTRNVKFNARLLRHFACWEKLFQ